MPRPVLTSRRALLALAGGAALGATAGCDVGTGPGARGGRAGAPAADPDQRLLDSAVTELKVLREQVLRTIDRHPGTREDLSAVTTCLEAHLRVLGEEDLTTPTPAAPPSPGPTATGSPGATDPADGTATESPDEVPDDPKAALTAVVRVLTTHAEALTGWCARAESGAFARLLAVMCAGTTQYLTTLRKAAQG